MQKYGFIFLPEEIKYGLPYAIDDFSLAQHLGIRNKTLWWLVTQNEKLYTPFKIKKRNKFGGHRMIHTPAARLKVVQKVLLYRFLNKVPLGKHVGAYITGKGCTDTAAQHTKKAVIISLDIKNFFHSVKRSVIRNFFSKHIGYAHKTASLVAQLMCYKNFVPQGAPTSGAIANIIANYTFDQVIIRRLKAWDSAWVYTRYSDDIAVSHPKKQDKQAVGKVITIVSEALKYAGFRMHTRKTKVQAYWDRQQILGIVVNEKLNIPRFEYMRMRSLIHNCLVHGFESQCSRAGFNTGNELYTHLLGKLAYLKQLNKTKAQELKAQLELARELEEMDERQQLQMANS